MHFFSGFCFANEEELFSSFVNLGGKYTFNGFSYGAIKAFKATLHALKSNKRIQTLNLFSPAFFQDRKESFLKMQVLGFKKDSHRYIRNFLTLCGNPHPKYFKPGTLQELQELLFFQWDKKDLAFLRDLGVQINVYLGGEDQILNSQNIADFFAPFSVVYLYKHLNHCLQCDHL